MKDLVSNKYEYNLRHCVNYNHETLPSKHIAGSPFYDAEMVIEILGHNSNSNTTKLKIEKGKTMSFVFYKS